MPAITVHELVKLYAQKQGADDVAGPELQRMGAKAKDELIRILDDTKTPDLDASAAIEILHVYFPSDDSFAAINRFGSRISDPAQRKMFQDVHAMIRKNDPRKK